MLGRFHPIAERPGHDSSALPKMFGLNKAQFLVSGIPEDYVFRIQERALNQFPELELILHSFLHPSLS